MLTVNGYEVKVGDVWYTRGGRVVKVIGVSAGDEWPIQLATHKGVRLCDAQGRCREGTSDNQDLHKSVSGNRIQTTAPDILSAAASHMAARAATYDKPEGERSMGKTVAAFNNITGHVITEAEGWLLLQLLKDVRLFQRDGYHQDSAEDCVAYAALKAEAKAKEAING